MADLKSTQGGAQVYEEEVCFRGGQVWAGESEGDTSMLRFVWGAEKMQMNTDTWLGKVKQVNDIVTVIKEIW